MGLTQKTKLSSDISGIIQAIEGCLTVGEFSEQRDLPAPLGCISPDATLGPGSLQAYPSHSGSPPFVLC